MDELNSCIGIIRCNELPDGMDQIFSDIQHTLSELGGELSIPATTILSDKETSHLESLLDGYNEELPMLKEFILPARR